MGLKWCKLHDLPEPCDKCQAKTPDDVRKALAKIVYKYSYEPEPFTEFKQALEDFIKPLIEAAKIERDDEWRDIVTTFITSSTKRMESHLSKIDKEEENNG